MKKFCLVALMLSAIVGCGKTNKNAAENEGDFKVSAEDLQGTPANFNGQWKGSACQLTYQSKSYPCTLSMSLALANDELSEDAEFAVAHQTGQQLHGQQKVVGNTLMSGSVNRGAIGARAIRLDLSGPKNTGGSGYDIDLTTVKFTGPNSMAFKWNMINNKEPEHALVITGKLKRE